MVLYTTSVRAVRKTHEMCKEVLHILQAHQVALTVKDVFLHPDYAKELSERMGSNSRETLPQVAPCLELVHFHKQHMGPGLETNL